MAMEDGASERGSSPTINGFRLRSRLVEIEGQVAMLESQLTDLRVEKEGLLRRLDSIIYPVLTIPPEVTSEIFFHDVDTDTHRPDPLRLASVCRTWRAIALSTPRLWNYFSSGPTRIRSTEVLSSRLHSWLPRAGNLPLTLSIESPKLSSDGAILAILAQYAAQWISLDLTSYMPISSPIDKIRTPLSSLKKIKLHIPSLRGGVSTCIMAFLDAPQLREAYLHGLSLTQVSLPWIQLTKLQLFGLSLGECLDILEQTPHLEDLSFAPITLHGPSIPSPRTIIGLRALHLMSDESCAILDHLTLPALNDLNLYRLSNEGVTRVESFVARSGCSVRVLELSHTMFTETYICVRNLPSLTEVTLQFPPWPSANFSQLFDRMAECKSPLPALESFNVNYCLEDIDVCSLAAMISARWTGVQGAAKLKSFSFSHRGDPRDLSVEQSLGELRALRLQGLKMDVGWLPKWATTSLNLQMMDEIRNDEMS
ncbi:hypothetical protein B0H17DRAFT_1199109 [Mycena rosella]|uniref:F-box domain-containing protein n=1 Tax=Mycena rosella TaxID=1033263 RepID=A0AAD7DM53_MYCRO|nr:hypothetical protein B0H17DRAFT_1199109 [Mycena rosella]